MIKITIAIYSNEDKERETISLCCKRALEEEEEEVTARGAAASRTCRRPRHDGCLRRLWHSCPPWRAGPAMPKCWRGRRGQSWRCQWAGHSADSGQGGGGSQAGPAPAAERAGVLEAAAA